MIRNFGEAIKFRYIDVNSDEIKEYPDVAKILHKVRLPLTVIDGKPRFHGGFFFGMIAGEIQKILKE